MGEPFSRSRENCYGGPEVRVVIKANHLVPGGGMVHFNEVTRWFGRLAQDTQFIVLAQEGQQEMIDNVPNNFEYHYYRTPSRNLITRILWEQFSLPKIIRSFAPDLLFEPGNYGTGGVTCPKVSLLHNIAPFATEYIKTETIYQRFRLNLLRWATIRSMRSSQGVIFLADYYRKYMEQYLDYDQIKSAVIYHGGQETVRELDSKSVLKEMGITGEYLLSVSHVYRYKNIKEMVQSYCIALKETADLPPLYIAGELYDKEYADEIRDLLVEAHLEDQVVFLGSVDQDRLRVLYRNCRAFLFSSTLETCSVILIEAMGNGCAIACSDRSVMPEVTGNGAVYFDPDNIEQIAKAIIKISTDEKENARVRAHSARRAEYFSWEKTARQTLEFFDKVLRIDRPVIADKEMVEIDTNQLEQVGV